MTVKPSLFVLLVSALLALPTAAAHTVLAQRSDSGDRTVENLVATTLSEIGLPGRVRVVRVTMAPGAVRGDHKHDGRSALQVILQGTVTEYRGDQSFVRTEGDVFTIPEGVTHATENTGTTAAVYIEVNIFPE